MFNSWEHIKTDLHHLHPWWACFLCHILFNRGYIFSDKWKSYSIKQRGTVAPGGVAASRETCLHLSRSWTHNQRGTRPYTWHVPGRTSSWCFFANISQEEKHWAGCILAIFSSVCYELSYLWVRGTKLWRKAWDSMRLPGCNVCSLGSACQHVQISPGRCLSLGPDTQRTAAVGQCNQPGNRLTEDPRTCGLLKQASPQMLTGKISPKSHLVMDTPPAGLSGEPRASISGYFLAICGGQTQQVQSQIHHLPTHLPRPPVITSNVTLLSIYYRLKSLLLGFFFFC